MEAWDGTRSNMEAWRIMGPDAETGPRTKAWGSNKISMEAPGSTA